jgi:hypothetical protein
MITELLLYNLVLCPPYKTTDVSYTTEAGTIDVDAGVMIKLKPSSNCIVNVYPKNGSVLDGDDGMRLETGETERFFVPEDITIDVVQVSASGTLKVTEYQIWDDNLSH